MYKNVSQEFSAIITDSGRSFKAKLVNGADEITDVRSLTLYQAENGSDNIGIGGGVAGYIDCTIGNTELPLENVEYDLYLGLKVSEDIYEYVPIGKFTPKKPTIKSEITVFTAYDRMMGNSFSIGYFSDIENYPVDAKDILLEIEHQAGIDIDTSNLPSGLMIDRRTVIADSGMDEDGNEFQNTMYEKPFTGYTIRETICYIAQMFGKFAYVDRNGSVKFGWFEDCGLRYIESQYKDDVGESESEFILGVIKCSTGENELISGAGTVGISIENPVMTQEILDNVYQLVGGFRCKGISVTLIGDIRLDVGDIIQIRQNGEYIEIPVMKLETTFDGGISQKVYAFGNVDSIEERKGPTAERLDRLYNELLLVKEVVANKVSTDSLEARVANLGFASIKELTAEVAKMGLLTADKVSAVVADISDLAADSAFMKNIKAEILNAEVIKAAVADVGYLTADSLKAQVADMGFMTADEADINYAKIDFSNIEMATIGQIFSDIGLVKDMTIVDGHITGTLSGVKITGDVIETNTIKADSLLLTGEDGIIYKINATSSGLSKEELSDEKYRKYLSGTDIVAKSITADQIAASTITTSELNVENIFGDEAVINTITSQEAFINAISTNMLVVGAADSAKSALETVKELEQRADSGEFKGEKGDTGEKGATGKGVSSIVEQYYLSTSSAAQTGGSWSNTCPAWANGKYIWMRQYITWSDGTATTTTPTLDNAVNSANQYAYSADSAIAAWCYNNDKTYINGAKLYTGTVTANKLSVSTLSAISANLGTVTAGVIQSSNYRKDTSGMQLNLSDGSWDSKYTKIDGSGKIECNQLIANGGSIAGLNISETELYNDIFSLKQKSNGVEFVIKDTDKTTELFAIKTSHPANSGMWNSLDIANFNEVNISADDVYINQINGYVLGAACAKGVVASVASGNSNLVTSGAVYNALTNGTVSKVGTATVGNYGIPVYMNAGKPTACLAKNMSASLGMGRILCARSATSNSKFLNITCNLLSYLATSYLIIIFENSTMVHAVLINGYTASSTLTNVADNARFILYAYSDNHSTIPSKYISSTKQSINDGKTVRLKYGMGGSSGGWDAYVICLGAAAGADYTAAWADT